MSVNESDCAEFEGQIFVIPAQLRGIRGLLAEWLLRAVGLIAATVLFWVILSGSLLRTPGVVFVLLGTGAYATLALSWNVRCWRFGWRFRYIGTFQYFDRSHRRTRLEVPAPNVPANTNEAHTSFLLRPVRRLDGSKTW